ncbi:hypothetical protein T440DRAFT_533261 [Plenodomus tracheiphilus IPT5]|uniref:Uncharacterized protein n=1 Tax=Plenodomus tracheiphilus IPT5 TaxID=1408161 RepID=A0A6A7B5U8_9PLEO|nr:hypothetical protein T440DRAFT_533261 [Plenodomus tracheiphilus IPT5]
MSYRSSISSNTRSNPHHAWTKHEDALQHIKIDAQDLDTQIRVVEKAWQEEEMDKPENERWQHNFLEWILALKKADSLIYQINRLCESAGAWRRRWSPSTPHDIQRAYDCVYAHALGLIDDECVAPARVLEALQQQLVECREKFAELAGDNDMEGIFEYEAQDCAQLPRSHAIIMGRHNSATMFRGFLHSTRGLWTLRSSLSTSSLRSTSPSNPFDSTKNAITSRFCPNLTNTPSATAVSQFKSLSKQSSVRERSASLTQPIIPDTANPIGISDRSSSPSTPVPPSASTSASIASTEAQTLHNDNNPPSSTVLPRMTKPILPPSIIRLNAILVSIQNYYYIYSPPDFDPSILAAIEHWRPNLLDAKREWERVRQWEGKMGWGLGFGVGSGVMMSVGSGSGGVRDSMGSGIRGAMDEEEFGALVREVLREIEELIEQIEGVFWGSVVRL